MQFQSNIFTVPGLGNSGEGHWQTIWEQQFNFTRIQQRDWDTPVCSDWIAAIDAAVTGAPQMHEVILVGHSLACTTIAAWAHQYQRLIKGALLVAPSNTEADSYPTGTTGFIPMVLNPLPFPSITVTSNNDYYVTPEKAAQFAASWGSRLHNIGDAGHINVSAGYGEWWQGLHYLLELDKIPF
ncbi:RBBP9/YdeN family alpha/beta hydrolase [Deminuibacter soli]|uniref:Alpha/beta hydrolase n=1 Tax=Deminuibacter soli TaxID=2291815 RepID=A0A3E1NKP1_9BACT|nr:alpha/beta hydrolase [Deminuibacter soli]RFM28482.1 alpha/beta hydrolase [Deminuibacter soli]